MGQFRRRMYEYYTEEFSTEEPFNLAVKKVRRIKRFYWHLTVYFIVNVAVIVSNLNNDFFGIGYDGASYGIFDRKTYSIAILWGIAILIDAFKVFGPNIFFSDAWEQNKIQKYIEEEAQNKNKWE